MNLDDAGSQVCLGEAFFSTSPLKSRFYTFSTPGLSKLVKVRHDDNVSNSGTRALTIRIYYVEIDGYSKVLGGWTTQSGEMPRKSASIIKPCKLPLTLQMSLAPILISKPENPEGLKVYKGNFY